MADLECKEPFDSPGNNWLSPWVLEVGWCQSAAQRRMRLVLLLRWTSESGHDGEVWVQQFLWRRKTR
ncbi:hypothetical protein Hamer_G031828 [Homarus americanus]|uniref:Uncharacterized protein n=1 Tax=Homarus americanus TaxID=6706 RepID=A0A8J5N4L8_HOMAM|nr:hypothetical protein Hamer_G031828 [Homarus americanus]